MKITRMQILAADVAHPYIFVKLHTDEGIYGVASHRSPSTQSVQEDTPKLESCR
jgi:hypothetical protein